MPRAARFARSALLAGAVIPWPSDAAVTDGGAQRADGVALEVAPGDYSTTGNTRPVLSAVNGGVLTTTGKTRLFSSGFSAAGASAWHTGSRIVLRNAEIRTRGPLGYGLDARFGGTVLANDIAIDTDGNSAHGVYVDVSGNGVDIAGSAIVTRGRESYGIAVNYAPGAVVNAADTLIRTGGTFAYGVFLSYDDIRATLDRVDVRTTGDYASALFMPGASTAIFNDTRLETDGYTALGVDTRKGNVELARTRVFTHGESAHGLYASKEYDETPVIRTTGTDVATSGAYSIGVVARLGGRVAMTGGSIATSGQRAYGLLSSGAGSIASITDGAVTTVGRNAAALYAGKGSSIDLLRTDVRTSGDGAPAAAAYGGSLTVDGGSLVSERHGAIDASDAVITLRNGARAVGGNGALLSVDAQSGATVRLALDTGAQAAGDIANRPSGDGNPTPAVTDVALSRASAWTGATDAIRALSLDTGSRWTVTADSWVGSVALNNSTIAFAPPDASTPRTLVVTGDYAANDGRLVMHTLLGDDSSPTDRLVIDGGHASGNTGIVVKRTGGEGAQTTIGIPIVETRNGGTTDAAAFALDAASDGYRNGFGTLSAGGYDYMLARGGKGGRAEDWYLVSAAKPVEPPPTPEPGEDDTALHPETVDPPGPTAVAPEPDAYLANADAAAMMAVHSLHQREDRSLRADSPRTGAIDGAVWVRAEGELASRSGGERSVRGNGRRVHAGADLLRFDDGRGGSFRLGAMGMYGSFTSWSTRTLWNAAERREAPATARGSVDGYNAGLYGTWYGNRDILSGPYVDTWWLYGVYQNTIGGSLAGDSYRSSTVTGSVEAGYSLPLYEQGVSRFFVEPQAQLVYSHYRASAHDAPSGRVGTQSANDVLTRLGVRVHGVTAMPAGRELRPFVEANWWHGPGSRSLTIDGNTFDYGVPRDRAALAAGATGQFTKRMSVSASIGVDTDFGDYATVKGQLAAKYRW
ncbi:autotransporter family protein [Burkholderia ubonensis]|uniref:Autotransporter outer membrane beta-barrel domain-containing protein n=1 Tax=Burkholderia ubonensis subsp. mesacidophila TaxID=265293 RepID=A0A2A4FBQ8_9BURK|nr:autotransporter outer membrane beta-barrel domain-containing protein [Burkholderia ubonensis]PCE31213.1 autotransporter outer membrane beta-barrel domain-containing protein [Burkholderia ubonensis subsp. mesacidophila]